jgi:hypothetical protein
VYTGILFIVLAVKAGGGVFTVFGTKTTGDGVYVGVLLSTEGDGVLFTDFVGGLETTEGVFFDDDTGVFDLDVVVTFADVTGVAGGEDGIGVVFAGVVFLDVVETEGEDETCDTLSIDGDETFDT